VLDVAAGVVDEHVEPIQRVRGCLNELAWALVGGEVGLDDGVVAVEFVAKLAGAVLARVSVEGEWAPSRARRFAMADPMPPVAPVTIARECSKRIGS
jgi:hypothetical protein